MYGAPYVALDVGDGESVGQPRGQPQLGDAHGPVLLLAGVVVYLCVFITGYADVAMNDVFMGFGCAQTLLWTYFWTWIVFYGPLTVFTPACAAYTRSGTARSGVYVCGGCIQMVLAAWGMFEVMQCETNYHGATSSRAWVPCVVTFLISGGTGFLFLAMGLGQS